MLVKSWMNERIRRVGRKREGEQKQEEERREGVSYQSFCAVIRDVDRKGSSQKKRERERERENEKKDKQETLKREILKMSPPKFPPKDV